MMVSDMDGDVDTDDGLDTDTSVDWVEVQGCASGNWAGGWAGGLGSAGWKSWSAFYTSLEEGFEVK